jgi:spore germination cell wall hydrolase CwlJ-like protein
MGNVMFRGLNDETLFALLLFGEARGEGIEGRAAVAAVVMNRLKLGWYGDGLAAVILSPLQFSCFNPDDPNREQLERFVREWEGQIKTNNSLRESWWVAKGVIEGWLISNVGNATHYHAGSVAPAWAKKLTFIKTVGNHKFYVEHRR